MSIRRFSTSHALRRRFLPAAIAASAVLLFPTSSLSAQTRTVTGRVVTLDGADAGSVRLRFVGIGDLVLTSSGEFTIEIPADVDVLTIAARDASLSIVFPADGRFPVPPQGEPLNVLVGEPVHKTVTRALAERRLQSERLLKELGVQGDRLSGIESGMQEIIRLLNVREADLRDEVARKERQAGIFPEIAAAITDWTTQTKDLHTELKLTVPAVIETFDNQNTAQKVYDGLAAAFGRYGASMQRLRNERTRFETDLEMFWPDGPVVRREFADFMDNVFEDVHTRVWALNDPYMGVLNQRLLTRRDESQVRTLEEMISRLRDIEVELDRLDTRASRLIESIRPS